MSERVAISSSCRPKSWVFVSAAAQSLFARQRSSAFHSGGSAMDRMTAETNRMNLKTAPSIAATPRGCSSAVTQPRVSTASHQRRSATALRSAPTAQTNWDVSLTHAWTHSSSAGIHQSAFHRLTGATESKTVLTELMKRTAVCFHPNLNESKC